MKFTLNFIYSSRLQSWAESLGRKRTSEMLILLRLIEESTHEVLTLLMSY